MKAGIMALDRLLHWMAHAALYGHNDKHQTYGHKLGNDDEETLLHYLFCPATTKRARNEDQDYFTLVAFFFA